MVNHCTLLQWTQAAVVQAAVVVRFVVLELLVRTMHLMRVSVQKDWVSS